MASGVLRPYTVSDVIGSLSDGIDALSGTDSTSAGTGYFTEADEVIGLTDSVTVTSAANPPWGEGTWSQFIWQ